LNRIEGKPFWGTEHLKYAPLRKILKIAIKICRICWRNRRCRMYTFWIKLVGYWLHKICTLKRDRRTDGVGQLLHLLSPSVTQDKITQHVDIFIFSSNKRKCYLQYINKQLIFNLKHVPSRLKQQNELSRKNLRHIFT
jgi:hypothetical protein